MHGSGVFYYSDGDVFEGESEHGKFCRGKYTYANNQVYTGKIFICDNMFILLGEFKENQPYGKGEVRYPNGDIYSGEWKEGRREGFGKYLTDRDMQCRAYYLRYIYKNGNIYEGQYFNDKKHGRGTEWIDGDKYHTHHSSLGIVLEILSQHCRRLLQEPATGLR
jgi:hypothetical protein